MSNLWLGFVTLSRWGIGFLFAEWFVYVTVPLLINLAVSSAWTWTRRPQHWKHWYIAMFFPLVAYPVIAFVGATAWFSSVPVPPLNRPSPNVIAGWCVLILNVLSFAFGIFMICKMKGLRWLSISMFLMIQWMLQGINFTVSMPIGGVWL
ncbi:MAG: hypothetical protein WBN92_07210 [Terriglobia bacterium]